MPTKPTLPHTQRAPPTITAFNLRVFLYRPSSLPTRILASFIPHHVSRPDSRVVCLQGAPHLTANRASSAETFQSTLCSLPVDLPSLLYASPHRLPRPL